MAVVGDFIAHNEGECEEYKFTEGAEWVSLGEWADNRWTEEGKVKDPTQGKILFCFAWGLCVRQCNLKFGT